MIGGNTYSSVPLGGIDQIFRLLQSRKASGRPVDPASERRLYEEYFGGLAKEAGSREAASRALELQEKGLDETKRYHDLSNNIALRELDIKEDAAKGNPIASLTGAASNIGGTWLTAKMLGLGDKPNPAVDPAAATKAAGIAQPTVAPSIQSVAPSTSPIMATKTGLPLEEIPNYMAGVDGKTALGIGMPQSPLAMGGQAANMLSLSGPASALPEVPIQGVNIGGIGGAGQVVPDAGVTGTTSVLPEGIETLTSAANTGGADAAAASAAETGTAIQEATHATEMGSGIPGYAVPIIGGIARAGTGLLTGEKPLEALSHGAATGLGAWGGAELGGAIGTYFGPVGTVVGGAIGAIIGAVGGDSALSWIEDSCIIVTACNGRDSYEVDVTRRYRDAFMDDDSIRGYYMIAEKVVPIMWVMPEFEAWVKRNLVDHLIEYGRWKLGDTDKRPSVRSWAVSRAFLALCRQTGRRRASYMRVTGEVY